MEWYRQGWSSIWAHALALQLTSIDKTWQKSAWIPDGPCSGTMCMLQAKKNHNFGEQPEGPGSFEFTSNSPKRKKKKNQSIQTETE